MSSAESIPFLVKICGITNESDAHVAIAAGANALGFNFYKRSPRYIEPENAREITKSIPQGILKVGIFVNVREAELEAIIREDWLDVVQLHGVDCAFPPPNYRIWRAVHAADNNFHADSKVEAYLVDTPSENFGGSGRPFPWKVAANLPYRTIIAGGLDASNVAEAIHIARPWGVDACSRLESRPGKKDAQRVREFVRAALAAVEKREIAV